MSEKYKTNYEKMARNARFKTYFFQANSGDQFIINSITSANGKMYCSDSSGQYIIKSYETINENIIVGDLQQLHEPNAQKVIIGNNGNIENADDFPENEFLGYNNVFLYDSKSKILALQHNINGCGIKSFQAILNTYNPSILSNNTDNYFIDFAIEISKTNIDNVENFSKLALKFKIAKNHNPSSSGLNPTVFNNTHLDKIAQIGNDCNGEYMTVIIGSTKCLDKPIIKSFAQTLTQDNNKQFIDKFILDCQLSNGENAELNFIINRAQKIKDIEYGTQLDYALRKDIIKEHYNEFISEKCKEL